MNFPNTAGTQTVYATEATPEDLRWQYAIPSTCLPWLTFHRAPSSDASFFILSVTANTTTSSRTCVLQIRSISGTRPILVTQEGTSAAARAGVPVYHTVTYYTCEGCTAWKTDAKEFDGPLKLAEAPSKPGYTFLGWARLNKWGQAVLTYRAGETMTHDDVPSLYAAWEPTNHAELTARDIEQAVVSNPGKFTYFPYDPKSSKSLNCYQYALNSANQPGDLIRVTEDAGVIAGKKQLDINGVRADLAQQGYDLTLLTKSNINSVSGGYVIAYTSSGGDYHFYRMDAPTSGQARWSHKPGDMPITDRPFDYHFYAYDGREFFDRGSALTAANADSGKYDYKVSPKSKSWDEGHLIDPQLDASLRGYGGEFTYYMVSKRASSTPPSTPPSSTPTVTLLSSSVAYASSSATKQVNFVLSSGTTWTVTNPCPDWVSVTRNASSVSLTAKENTSTSSRSCKVTITPDGGKGETITLNQEGAPQPTVSLSSSTVNFPYNTATATVNVTTKPSGATWTVGNASNCLWLTVTQNASSVSLTAKTNTIDGSRTCFITIKPTNGNAQTITINQVKGAYRVNYDGNGQTSGKPTADYHTVVIGGTWYPAAGGTLKRNGYPRLRGWTTTRYSGECPANATLYNSSSAQTMNSTWIARASTRDEIWLYACWNSS